MADENAGGGARPGSGAATSDVSRRECGPSLEAVHPRGHRLRENLLSWPTLLTLLMLVGAEVALRTWWVKPELPDWFLEADPFVLWDMPPGIRHELGIGVRVNRLGIRGAEIEIPKPSGAKRLFALGDSSVYGFGVQDEEVFAVVAGKRLAESTGMEIEGITGGVGGYSTFQALRRLEQKGPLVEPDLLIIATLWSDNMFDTFVDRDLLELYQAKSRPAVSATHRFFSQSAIFRTLDWYLRGRHQTRHAYIINWMQDQRLHTTGRRRVAIDDYVANLEALVGKGRALGAESMFVILANRDDVSAEVFGERPWRVYREAMRDTAVRLGAPLLEVPSLFKDSGLSTDALFLDAMHPSPRGHRIIGEAIAEMLEERRWPGMPLMGASDGSRTRAYDDTFLRFMPPGASMHGTDGSGPGMMAPFGGLEGFIAQVDARARRGSSVGDGSLLPPGAPGRGHSRGHPEQGGAAAGRRAAGPLQPTAHDASRAIPPTGSVPTGEPTVSDDSAPSVHTGPTSQPTMAAPLALKGVLRATRLEARAIQIDLVSPTAGVLGSTRLSGPGAFTVPTRGAGKAFLQVIIDLAGDGPSRDDPFLRFESQAVTLDSVTIEGVEISLDAQTLTLPPTHRASP